MSDTLIINGEVNPFTPQTIVELLRAQGRDPERAGIAVAVNARVVPRHDWASRRLMPGDRLEIIQAIAGG